MKLPHLTQHKTNMKSGSTNSTVVKQWLLLLFVGLVLLSAVSVYSVGRFNYWSQIGEAVSAEDVVDVGYDKKSFDLIVETIKDNEITRDELFDFLSEGNNPELATTPEGNSTTSDLFIIGVTSDYGE